MSDEISPAAPNVPLVHAVVYTTPVLSAARPAATFAVALRWPMHQQERALAHNPNRSAGRQAHRCGSQFRQVLTILSNAISAQIQRRSDVANPHNFVRRGSFDRRVSDHRTISVADRPRDQKTAALAAHITHPFRAAVESGNL
jgi:hypothetical protein